MNSNVLWGALAITAFSLIGFLLLSAGGLIQRVPARFRGYVGVGGWGLYSLFLSGSLYQVLFRENGLVVQGALSEGWALAIWGVLTAALAAGTLHRVSRALRPPSHTKGSGASA